MVRSTSTEDLGEPIPYDPDFNGPLKNRSCTDVVCLFLFLVFIGCWIGIGIYAYTSGDPNTLLVPKDSSGSRCGIDAHVRDKKYLFFFDLTRCLDATVPFTGCKTKQVCVSRCPKENYFLDGTRYKGDTEYCSNYDKTDCPSWYLISDVFQSRCIPKLSFINEAIIDRISKISHVEMTEEKMKTSISNIKLFAEAEEFGQNVVEDIAESIWKILAGIVIAFIVCIIYILILRCCAAPIIWLSIIFAVAALGVGIYFTTTKYIEFRDAYNAETNKEIKSQLKVERDLCLVGLIVICVVEAIILLLLIFLRKRIMLAIALVKEGSKAISSVTAALFFPLFPWLIQLAIIVYAVSVGLFLASTGEAVYKTRYLSGTSCVLGNQDDVGCDPEKFAKDLAALTSAQKPACAAATCKFVRIQNGVLYPYLQAINVFGFFWLAFFASALGQMVLASVFAQWYWTFYKRTLPFFAVTEAFFRTVRYHVGTLAFGSLIIAICRMVRVCLEYLDNKLRKYDNGVTKAIMCCCKCLFWCLEKFLIFINKNAYIMCAIHGKNFCASARSAFMLLMRNIVRVFVLDKVADFLLFLSKLLITLGVGALSYFLFVTDITPIDNSGLHYRIVPVVIIMICTYLMAAVFFSVYSMAVDTLFLCFLEDCERNDGSTEKPYYMSKDLMKIFGKKNKIT